MAKKTEKKKSKAASPGLSGYLKKHVFIVALVVLVGIVFGNTLSNGYALDDDYYTNGGTSQTAQNIRKGFSGIPKLLTTLTFQGREGEGYAYRPVVAISFAIEHALFGESAKASHFISLLLYALTVVVLFLLLKRWFPAQGEWFVFFVCLLFLVHPLHTEVVNNIKSRDELLAMLGALGCFYFAWRHIETGRWYYLLLYPLCFLLGMFSKRTIIPYYVLFPMALWFFSKQNWKKIALYMVPLIIVAAISALAQQQLLPQQQREYLLLENPFPTGHYGIAAKTATSAYILGRYLWLHIIPHPLVYYYGFRHVPVVDWSNIIAIAGLLVHVFLGVVALLGLRKRSLLSFAILFYLVNMAAYSNLLQPAPGMMAERFTYSATIGFCIAITWLVFKLLKTEPQNFAWGETNTVRIVLLGIAGLFAMRSFVRNGDWESKITLYGNDMEYLEESAKANMMLGQLYLYDGIQKNNQQELELARKNFQKAVEITPGYSIAWNDLGTASFFLGEYSAAAKEFGKSLALDPKNVNTVYSMGLSLYKMQQLDSALPYFQRTLRLDSMQMRAWEYVARITSEKGNPDEALRILERAAKTDPKNELPYEVMASIHMKDKKDTVMAIALYEKSLQMNPRNLQRIGGLAEYFKQKGNTEKLQYYSDMYMRIKQEMETAAQQKK
ncbi:MAG: hypothetical protein FD123_2129 [Bacteroidetes bacterium]|nr:MAG: hypothetical protein FD123_2129 [Bacteroidota bacterium]